MLHLFINKPNHLKQTSKTCFLWVLFYSLNRAMSCSILGTFDLYQKTLISFFLHSFIYFFDTFSLALPSHSLHLSSSASVSHIRHQIHICWNLPDSPGCSCSDSFAPVHIAPSAGAASDPICIHIWSWCAYHQKYPFSSQDHP